MTQNNLVPGQELSGSRRLSHDLPTEVPWGGREGDRPSLIRLPGRNRRAQDESLPPLSYADSAAIVAGWSKERREEHARAVTAARGSEPRAQHVATTRRMLTDAELEALRGVDAEAERLHADGLNAADARRLAVRFAIEGV